MSGFQWAASLLIVASAPAALGLAWRPVRARRISGLGFLGALSLTQFGALVMVGAGGILEMFTGFGAIIAGGSWLCCTEKSRKAQEAGLKFFAYGAFALAVAGLGSALIHREVALHSGGSSSWEHLARFYASNEVSLLAAVAAAVVFSALAFLAGAVPFHMWAPDVLEGAPTPAAAAIAVTTKVASVASLCQLLLHTRGGDGPLRYGLALEIIAAATLLVGHLVAVRQTLVKRMLAYATVAQGGYVLLALVASVHGSRVPAAGVTFYLLVTYTVVSLGAFGAVSAAESRTSGQEDLDLDALNGMSGRHPLLALAGLVLLLSLAGFPPTAGAYGQFFLFLSIFDADRIGLLVFSAIGSVAGAYVYLRVVVRMYLTDGPTDRVISPVSRWLSGGVFVCALVSLVVGIWPEVFMALSSG